MRSTGNLRGEAQALYTYMSVLIQADSPPPAGVPSVDIRSTADAWGSSEKRRMRRLLKDAGVAVVPRDPEQVPFPREDASQDVVILTEVHEHLRDYR